MHTKEELTKKKAQSSEQLDLVESISRDDSLRKKRIFLYIAIFITIGLSIIFWLFRTLKTVNFSTPELPSFSINSKVDTNTRISQILGKDSFKWEINFVPEPSVLTQLKSSSSSLIKDLLPEGLDITEEYVASETSQFFATQITIPQNSIYISIKYNSGNQDTFKTTLKKLIPAIYWSKVQSN
jgi:hypothetical protein